MVSVRNIPYLVKCLAVSYFGAWDFGPLHFCRQKNVDIVALIAPIAPIAGISNANAPQSARDPRAARRGEFGMQGQT